MKKIKLTDKEQYILELLSAGLTNPEISAKHNISVNTVKYHLKKIYGILEVKNRVEAAGWYMNHCKNKSKTNPYLKSNTMKNLISLRSLIIVIFITLFYSGTKAQLSGNYTIGKGGDFETFTEASAELNKVGVSGPVTFLVSSGIYEEQFTLGTISGAEPFRPIIFRSETGNPEDALLRFTPTSTDNNYIVHLQGCQFVEFKHLGFEVLDFGRVFLLDFSASHIVIDSCHLSGIFGTSSSVEQALIFSSDPDLENLTLAGNRFSNCGYGTYIQGGFNSPIPGIRILDNTFVNAGYTAVHLNTVENPVITGNIISDGYYGIHITSGLNSLSILKNQVFTKTVGIRVNYHNNQDPGLVANNFIVVEGTGDAYGLDIQNSSNINVYHNSVVIRSGQGGSKAFSCVSNTQGTVNVVNNSFSCMDEGYASYVNYPATIQRSDFNNYYSASNMMFKWGENLYDLPDLKNLSNEDDHSISVYPNHTSDTNLHVHTKWLARKGTFLAEVTDDIDGDLRNTEHPDIGAD